MQALPSAGGAGHGVLPDGFTLGVSEFLAPAASAGCSKRKRRPAGTPDPGAEVVALSPQTLMESDRYVCEICNQGFQRDQNLQMHRRRHKVPWKLLKRPNQLVTNKRVFICPERSCLHHNPAHALGDLVGIKKHYRRKHCTERQWKCDRCSKRYAVQSDYKAHLKTCGTRGHCCDCGRVFSRVESFIEHQDTCSAVKRKPTQSGSEFSERLKITHSRAIDRNSTESPSQSSDTTQAMSFSQSGMSDTAARFTDVDSTAVTDEHSRRIQTSPAAAAATRSAAMPAWLTQRPDELKSAADLLPSHRRAPADHADTDNILVQGVRLRVDIHASHGSRSPLTRCSSITSVYQAEVSCPESKSTLEPSLLLSIGRPPSGAEVDAKPSSSSVEREAFASAYHQRQTASSVGMIPSSRLPAVDFSDQLALSLPATMEGPGTEHAVLVSGFRMQAAAGTRVGPASQVGSSAVVQQATKKRHDQIFNCTDRMVDNYNPCAGSTSSYHEDRAAGNVVHESDPPGTRPSRRGFTNSQLEPATSSVITSRQYLLQDHIDIAETDHLFAVNEAFRSQNQMAVAAPAEALNQAREQARTDMNAAWSDLGRIRRSKDEARQECEEAQREIARAEALKREAREQLEIASAEGAYADRAREFAKRQIEVSEAELSEAKRLREHARSELEKATSQAGFSQPSFCLSCRSAIETNIIPSRRSTPTNSPASSTWSLRTAPPASTDQLHAAAGTGQLFMVPAVLGLKHGADQAMDSLDRMAWSKSNIVDQTPGFNNSAEGSSHPWAAGFRSMSTLATSVANGESPSSGGNPVVTSFHVSSPARSDREHITHKDLDLN